MLNLLHTCTYELVFDQNTGLEHDLLVFEVMEYQPKEIWNYRFSGIIYFPVLMASSTSTAPLHTISHIPID